MTDLGIGSLPRRRTKNGAQRTALVYGERRDTYADLERRTSQLANALREAGVARGDRVAYVGFNHPSLLETYFATARLGAIWVIVNARLAPPEIGYILRDSGASVVFYGNAHSVHAKQLDHLDQVTTTIAVEADGDPAWAKMVNAVDFERFLTQGTSEPVEEAISWDEPAMIMYTSGTTGRPKGATHTHGSLHFQYFQALIDTDFTRDEVMLATAPLFHVAGLNTMTLPTLIKGGTVIVHPSFDPGEVLRAIAQEGVTSFFAVPAMMDSLAQHPDFDGTDFSRLRNVLVGGSPLPDRMLRTWTQRGVAVLQGYGMTETAPGLYLLLAEDAVRKSGSAGKPHYWADAKVVDLDGDEVAPGETGEVIARGPNVMQGYWNLPESTAESIVDGWYRTEDLATMDGDGYVYIKGRLKEMYISGGENIYPAEVENAILDIEGVSEVAVIGVEDPQWGEVGRAFVVLHAGAALTEPDLLAALNGRLARYKLPKQVVFVGELPRTATGKLQKRLLRPTVAEE